MLKYFLQNIHIKLVTRTLLTYFLSNKTVEKLMYTKADSHIA